MFMVMMPFLEKFAPYFIAAALSFSAGGYAGYRFEFGYVEAAKLALATQQKNDATAAATANALAATYIAELERKDNAVERSFSSAVTKADLSAGVFGAQIASQAAEPGQDAPDAPVLSATLDEIAKGNQ
jgi:hypothetical protein